MINTFSKFYYGHEIGINNYIIPLDEGSGEINVELRVGNYSLQNFIKEVERALNQFGTQEYVVTVNRATRLITISAPNNFDLLFQTGSLSSISVRQLLGFTFNDFTSDNEYTGTIASGKEYIPQFKLQDYRAFSNNKEFLQSSVNESGKGIVEVVSFGVKQIMTCNIKFINNINRKSLQAKGLMKNDPQGVENANDFMTYIIGKADIEFMPDENDPSEFDTCLLERTEESKNGTSYLLKEMTETIKLNDYYETGKLTFRKVIV